jgi:hypothetical protein
MNKFAYLKDTNDHVFIVPLVEGNGSMKEFRWFNGMVQQAIRKMDTETWGESVTWIYVKKRLARHGDNLLCPHKNVLINTVKRAHQLWLEKESKAHEGVPNEV